MCGRSGWGWFDTIAVLRSSRVAAHKRGSRLRKRRGDPGQLNLFDAPERKAAPKPAAPLRVKTKRVLAPRVERPVVLSPRDAAAYLNVAVSTLKSWRAKNMDQVGGGAARGSFAIFLPISTRSWSAVRAVSTSPDNLYVLRDNKFSRAACELWRWDIGSDRRPFLMIKGRQR